MIDRHAILQLEKLGKHFPVLAITGPRQIGKTTLAKQYSRNLKKQFIYLDLESSRDFERLSVAPQLFLEELADKLVIIDEVQRLKNIFPLLRHLVDVKRKPQRFLLLGSASPDMIRDSSETLAGRIAFLELGGLSIKEAGEKIKRLWFRGGFPIPFLTGDNEIRRTWFENFLFTYVQRDLPALGSPASPLVMQRLIQMLAHLNGQLLNLSTISRALGLSVNTVKTYLDFLEHGYLVRRIQPWHSNFGKRIVKTPKIYIRDSGLLHHLLNVNSEGDVFSHPAVGFSFESFAVEQIANATGKRAELFFYKEHVGGEVDLVIARGIHILASVEFKLSSGASLTKQGNKTFQAIRAKKQFIVTFDRNSGYNAGKIKICSLDDFVNRELPALLK
ncbi:MAG: ATP-binding protein [Bacteroidetes bacterium]|nr:ATP-binding protein [Bacteroidota bacterium]